MSATEIPPRHGADDYAEVGKCCHCLTALYAEAPLVTYANQDLAHVACDRHEKRMKRSKP